ncbi:MAG: NAD(P)H-quinone oxidoreductase [Pyrinomonadaceae bacterium]
MKAVFIAEFGSIDNLELREVPEPPPPTGSGVLVRVRAAGLNRADLLQLEGLYPPPAGFAPEIPGLEFAGEIVEVGEHVRDLAAGDRVFAITAGEAQAEYISIDASLPTKIPESLSFTDAAAVPEVFITAHDAIFTLGNLRPRQTLLIHAVGSGVGLAALQLAKQREAVVLGTSRTIEKLDRCKEFGLDAAICTNAGMQFASLVKEKTNGAGADVILDLVGAAFFEENLASLAALGRLVLVGLTSGATASFDLRVALQKRATITGTTLRGRSLAEKAEATRKFADEVVPLLASGQIRANVDRVFPMTEAISAYKYIESNQSFGKVVLTF